MLEAGCLQQGIHEPALDRFITGEMLASLIRYSAGLSQVVIPVLYSGSGFKFFEKIHQPPIPCRVHQCLATFLNSHTTMFKKSHCYHDENIMMKSKHP